MPERTTVSRSVSNDLDKLDTVIDDEVRMKSSEEMKKSNHTSEVVFRNEQLQRSSNDSISNVITSYINPQKSVDANFAYQ